MIPVALKNKLVLASASGALAIAAVLVGWFEGRVHTPYKDPVGIWTVCEGHTGSGIVPGRRYTDAECDAFKMQDMRVAESYVNRLVKVPVNKWQKAALIDFTFNLGPSNLASSTLLRRLNAGDYAGACREYDRWNKARVRGTLTVLRGLVLRRDADQWVCEGGIN